MTLSPPDREELVELSHAYAAAADDRDYEALGALFADDGVLVPRPGVERAGPAAIASAVRALDRYEATFHQLGQIRLWDDGGWVRGETYCVAHHFGTDEEGAAADHVMYIRYQDTFVHLDRWRFSRRELLVPWSGFVTPGS